MRNLTLFFLLLSVTVASSTSAAASSTEGPLDARLTYMDEVMSGIAAPRRDGNFPDGPFPLKDIPKAVLKPCLDSDGRIAAAGESWQDSCVGIGDVTTPRARLDVACQLSETLWQLTCERGGIAHSSSLLKIKKTTKGWALQSTSLVENPWVHCAKYSSW